MGLISRHCRIETDNGEKGQTTEFYKFDLRIPLHYVNVIATSVIQVQTLVCTKIKCKK